MTAQHNHPPECCCPPAGTPGDDCPACPVHGVFASPRHGLPESMFRTRDFDCSIDEHLRIVHLRRLNDADENADNEWYR